MPLEASLFTRIVEFLQDYMHDVPQREAIVRLTFNHSPVINHINWQGTSHAFTAHLVKTLDQWDEASALEKLLASLQVGIDHQETIQQLIKQIRKVPNTMHWKGSPFPGLEAFQERHESIFFGREIEINQIVEMIRQHALVAIVGASGSGKSSLVHAGVITRLKRSHNEDWQVIRFTPDEAGVNNPFTSMRSALFRHWQTSDLPTYQAFEKNIMLLKTWCETHLSPHQSLLMLVDQFEENFTTVESEFRQIFIQALCQLLQLTNVRLVLVMRSDFYQYCIDVPDLAENLITSTFPLSVPRPWALYQMIAQPAEIAGLTIEAGLIEKILDDTGNEAGNLALMAYALDELYKIAAKRHDRHILFDDYKTLEGVQGAIGKRAEHVFATLDIVDKVFILEHVFRELVEVDERGTATRRRVKREQFNEAEQKLVEAFTQARLLITQESHVEVAHEALFRSWNRLKAWISEAQEDLILLRQMSNAANDWDRKGRPEFLLWPQERLNLVDEMQKRLHPTLTEIEQVFVSPEPERLLEAYLSDTREHHRLWIIDRWGKIGERAVASLIAAVAIYDEAFDAIRQVLDASVEKLRPYKDAARLELLHYLTDEEVFIREQSAYVLGNLGDGQAVPALIEAFKKTDNYFEMDDYETYVALRNTLAEALGELGDNRAVPALIEALEDKDYLLGTVAHALGRIGDNRAVPALIEALKNISELNFHPIVWALGDLGDNRAVSPLLEFLTERENDSSVIEALGKLGDNRALPALIDALNDQDRFVRQKTAQALGRLGDSRAVPALIEALSDQYIHTIQAAAFALVRISDEIGLQALRSNSDLTDQLIEWLINQQGHHEEIIQILESIGTPDALEIVRDWREEPDDTDDTELSF